MFCKGHPTSSIMELSTMGSGRKMVIEMVKVHRFGKTAVNSWDTGVTIKLTVKVDLFMQTGTYMREIGSMIKLTAEELMNTWMVPNILENGEKIDNTGMVLKVGQIMLNTKETTNMEKNMESEHSNGVMGRHILENFIIIIFTERECIPGQIAEYMRENGDPIKCTVRELLRGLMEENTLVNTSKIRNGVMASLSGLMVGVTVESGSMESNTGREHM